MQIMQYDNHYYVIYDMLWYYTAMCKLWYIMQIM